MPADGAPRRTGSGECLVHQILRGVGVTDADQDGAQALIPAAAVELREVRSLGCHTYSTHNACRRPTAWDCVLPVTYLTNLADQSYGCGVTPEVEHLLRELDGARKGALKKLDGLSEEDARRSTVDSGTNLAGLIQHLTFVESMWFEQVVGRQSSTHGIRSMLVDPSITLRQLRAACKASWAVSDEIIKGLGDGDAPVERNGKKHDLRWVIGVVLGETIRHTGQADIIREQIDGTTGR